jgi:uncharacterized protein (DUF488 family)
MPSNQHVIYTWGYRSAKGANPGRALRIAQEHGIVLVVDVRAHRGGRSRDWSGRDWEATFGQGFKPPHYVPVPALGNPGKSPEEWVPEDREMARFALRELGHSLTCGGSIMLVCACADPLRCHRRFVAAELAERTGSRVVHLNGVGDKWPEAEVPQ